MISLDSILSNPKKSFSTKEIAGALRTTQGSVQLWIDRGELKHEKVAGRYIIRGEWVRDYLSEKQSDGFKSVGEVLEGYELPFERDE